MQEKPSLYELQRLENIQQNKKVFEALGLPQAKLALREVCGGLRAPPEEPSDVDAAECAVTTTCPV